MIWISLILGCWVSYLLFRPKKEDPYWDGPAPSKDERIRNEKFIAEHVKMFPGSRSHFYKTHGKVIDHSEAIDKLEELQEALQKGQITQEYFDLQAEQLLPSIDIKDDVH